MAKTLGEVMLAASAALFLVHCAGDSTGQGELEPANQNAQTNASADSNTGNNAAAEEANAGDPQASQQTAKDDDVFGEGSAGTGNALKSGEDDGFGEGDGGATANAAASTGTANTAVETAPADATTVTNVTATTNLPPAAELEDAPQPPVEDVPPVVPPAAVAAPTPVVADDEDASTPFLQPEKKAPGARLHWVGYDYLEGEGLVRIEMVTHGHPRFNILQERNKAGQSELVVRFYNTELRHKLRRDIDASEFRSPVAFIRLRPDAAEATVDVVLTLRDAVQPRLFTKYGNVMLTFAIPDRYFGNSDLGDTPVAKAEVLPNARVLPILAAGSDVPAGVTLAKAFVNDPGAEAFKGAPKDGGRPVVPATARAAADTQPEAAPARAGFASPQPAPPPAAVAAPMIPPPAATALPPPSLPRALSRPSAVPRAVLPSGSSFKADVDAAKAAPKTPRPQAFPKALPKALPTRQPAVKPLPRGQDDGHELDEKLEDFDDGKGESTQAIDKFDVRVPAPASDLVEGRRFSVAGVAADASVDGNANAAAPQNAGNAAASNAASDSAGNGDILSAGTGDGALTNGGGAANTLPATASGGNTSADEFFGEDASGGGVNPEPEAPVKTNSPAAPKTAAPTAGAAPGEPPLDGAPDLAGEETEGVATGSNTPPASLGGRPMHLEFRGAPLTEVIRMLSEESHVNFVIPPDLGSKQIYISLSGVPFNDALRAIIDANSLGMMPAGPNLVRIDTLERLAKDREQEDERRKAELKLRPTKILIHRLSYAKAEAAAKMLGDMLGAAAKEDKRITVEIDVRTNSVIVNAPPGDLATVKALLERIDLETPQVKIASRIVELQKTFSDTFGISWGTPFNFDQGRGLGFGNLVFPNYMLSRYSVDAGGGAKKVGNMNFRFGSVNNSMALDLALAAEELRSTAEVLQSSNLTVEDNHDATIVAGRSDFFRPVAEAGVAAGGGGVGAALDEVTYNLTVKVTPHITADGAVQMLLDIQSDSPTPSSSPSAVAAKNNRKIQTSLLRRSGETAVIGGIYNTTKNHSASGVPILSSLPIIGALFRTTTNNEDKRELMVMVTPTIVTSSKAFTASGGNTPEGGTASPPAAGAGGQGQVAAGSGGAGNATSDATTAEEDPFGSNNSGGGNSGGNGGGGNNGGGTSNADGSDAGDDTSNVFGTSGSGGNGNAAGNTFGGSTQGNTANGNGGSNNTGGRNE